MMKMTFVLNLALVKLIGFKKNVEKFLQKFVGNNKRYLKYEKMLPPQNGG